MRHRRPVEPTAASPQAGPSGGHGGRPPQQTAHQSGQQHDQRRSDRFDDNSGDEVTHDMHPFHERTSSRQPRDIIVNPG